MPHIDHPIASAPHADVAARGHRGRRVLRVPARGPAALRPRPVRRRPLPALHAGVRQPAPERRGPAAHVRRRRLLRGRRQRLRRRRPVLARRCSCSGSGCPGASTSPPPSSAARSPARGCSRSAARTGCSSTPPARRGYDVTGVELSKNAADHAREQLGLTVHSSQLADAPLDGRLRRRLRVGHPRARPRPGRVLGRGEAAGGPRRRRAVLDAVLLVRCRRGCCARGGGR